MSWFPGFGRQLDAFADAIRPELAGFDAPAPSSDLRDRILRDRAAGARVILPADRAVRSSVLRRVAAAAALVAAALAIPLYRATRDRSPEARPIALFSFIGGVAHAEQPAGAPRLPAVVVEHPERLQPQSLVYRRELRDTADRVTKVVESRLSVTADTTHGVAVWRLVSSATSVGAAAPETKTETLFVDRRDLRLHARAVHVRPYRRWQGIQIQQRMSGDSVNGRMTLDDVHGMRRIARRLPADYAPYLSDVLAPVYFSTVSLDARWRGSLTLLGWAVVPMDVLHPVELRVTGEERVHVPAGTFDCWKIAIRHGAGGLDYWVRKSDGVAVQAVNDYDASAGGRWVVTLVRENGM